jgi:hypothetical protein
VFGDFRDAGGVPFPLERLKSPAAAAQSDDLDVELRAALYAAAARASADPRERERLLGEARRLDVLRCVVPR